MHIVLIHNAVVPPLKYGGTERVIFWLADALIQLGHQITLIAERGSVIAGAEVIPFQENWESLVPMSADLLHLWSTPATPPKKPFLVTIEGNGKVGEVFHPNTVFVSQKHAALHGSTHFVYNGLDPRNYEMEIQREDSLVFLAKANWKVKNLAGAIEIARAAQMPLDVLGSRDWPLGLNPSIQAVNRFFRRHFPRLAPIRYRGMVGDLEKRAVLKKARALLFPVLWHEPFGIAITEALASGCPVLGTPYGSLPEIITPRVGKLSATADELVQCLKKQNFEPHACRQRVFEGFTHLQMAEKYLKYYRTILETQTLGRTPALEGTEVSASKTEIKTRSQEPAETLLPWTPLH